MVKSNKLALNESRELFGVNFAKAGLWLASIGGLLGVGSQAVARAADAPTPAMLTLADQFDAADKAIAASDFATAERLYHNLAHDPNIEIRTEARFRHAMMLATHGRNADAALLFRAILDEKPDAAPIRLELARMLAMMGRDGDARKQLRQAQAGGLPPEVAVTVNQFLAALRSTKKFGGSVEVSIAPDSNINRATSAQTLDTVIAPLTLDSSAQAKSGVGLKLGGQAYARIPVSDKVAILARLSGSASLYRDTDFNDVSGSFAIGPEIMAGKDRLRPALGLTYRFYGGDLYARTQSVSVNWLHPMGRRSQLDMSLSANRVRYTRNMLQDGFLLDGNVTLEHSFSPQTGGSLTLSAMRQTANDPGYATASGGISAFAWRDLGKMTLFASAGFNALEADAQLFPFTARRKDRLYRLGVGMIFRQFKIGSFAPLVRVGQEWNQSTVGIYDYRRTNFEVGISRAF